MKGLSLVFLRLQQYFRMNKFIFILFLVGSITCSITFIYFYGNIITTKQISGTNEYALRKFEIYFDPIDRLSEEQEQVLQRYPLESWTVRTTLNPDQLKSNDMGKTFQKEMLQINGFFVQASLLNDISLFRSAGRIQFTEQEKENGEHVIILPPEFSKSTTLPKNLKINGKDYQIIGVHSNDNAFFIPFSTFAKEKFKIDNISLVLKSELKKSEEQAYLEDLKSLFPGSYIDDPSLARKMISQDTGKEVLLVVSIYVLSLLSFMFLMKFLIDSHTGEDIIYFLVGAKKRTIIQVMLIQNVVITLFSGFTGIIIHIILKDSFFERINLTPNIQYGAFDYFIILMMMVILTILVQIPFLIDYSRYSLIKLKNKYIMED